MRFCDGCGSPQSDRAIRALGRPELGIPGIFGRLADSPILSPAGRAQDFLLCAFLFIATALTIFPLFSGDFTSNWGSIESAYISDSVFIVNNFPNVSWFPFWYGGLPFHLSYPPLFIYSVAALHAAAGLTIGHSYRILSGIAYSATPVALYLLTKFLTKNRLPGFFAGLTYSFVPTFLPDPAPSHIGALTIFGEGPHLFGYALAVLAVLQLLRCLEKPTWYRCVLASVLMAFVALTNLIALYALAFFVVIAVATEAIYRNDRGLLVVFLCGLIAYGLIAFQFDWNFIRTSSQVSTETAGGVRYSILLLPVLMVAVIFVRRLFSRYLSERPNTKPAFFVSLWIMLLGIVVIGRTWFNMPQLAPQPNRYVPELDAGISLLVGLVILKVSKAIPSLRKIGVRNLSMARRGWILCMFLVLLLIGVFFLLPLSLRETQPTTSLANVPEYQISEWLSTHVKDESVFATGSVAFWLNVFSDVRQIRGGSDQGATNAWWAAVTYQILTGKDPSVSVLWAQAWNVKYVVVDFPNSTTAYHDYTYPDKFIGVLPLRYYFEGVGVYEVPLVHPALVQPISASEALSLSPISDILETRGVSAYVHLSQSSNTTSRIMYVINNSDLITISVTNASNDTAILVKTTFDPNWHADLEGTPIPIRQIGPDFMVLYPDTTGNYRIELHYDRSDGEVIGLYATITTIIILALVTSRRVYQKRRGSRIPQAPD